MTVSGLEAVEILLMDTNRLFELLDVLRPSLSEGSLCLPVPLLPLF